VVDPWSAVYRMLVAHMWMDKTVPYTYIISFVLFVKFILSQESLMMIPGGDRNTLKKVTDIVI
jgi:hypothetical protein